MFFHAKKIDNKNELVSGKLCPSASCLAAFSKTINSRLYLHVSNFVQETILVNVFPNQENKHLHQMND